MIDSNFYRTVVTPYWCKGNPLHWVDEGIGPAHFAAEGRVGYFNLCWLMYQRSVPPPAAVYRNTDTRWIFQYSGGVTIGRMTLQHHAAVRSLHEFSDVITRYTSERSYNANNYVPWGTLRHFAKKVLA